VAARDRVVVVVCAVAAVLEAPVEQDVRVVVRLNAATTSQSDRTDPA
jgi:hypothetical protein